MLTTTSSAMISCFAALMLMVKLAVAPSTPMTKAGKLKANDLADKLTAKLLKGAIVIQPTGVLATLSVGSSTVTRVTFEAPGGNVPVQDQSKADVNTLTLKAFFTVDDKTSTKVDVQITLFCTDKSGNYEATVRISFKLAKNSKGLLDTMPANVKKQTDKLANIETTLRVAIDNMLASEVATLGGCSYQPQPWQLNNK